MNKKEILELKRRMKKDACTFTRVCGCYVDSERKRILTLGKTFLNLDDEEFYKYLEIAKKTLSGTYGNNLLELSFPLEEEQTGGRQHFFTALRRSALQDDALLERFYDHIIDHYEYAGNYLILIFHDIYDVIAKATDCSSLDESEEAYEYLLCAICPVALSKPALGYRADENCIGPRIRDWVVGAPESGFLFPAFTDRSADIHAVLTYHKNPKEPHGELMEQILGCTARRTAAEQKMTLSSIVRQAFHNDEDASQKAFCALQQELSDLAAEHEAEDPQEEKEPVRLMAETVGGLLSDAAIREDAAAAIEEAYREEFQDEEPILGNLLDRKAAEEGGRLKQQKELIQKVADLEQQLGDVKTYDVILRVKPEKAAVIRSERIDGKKCLVIPMEENEHAAINGQNTTI